MPSNTLGTSGSSGGGPSPPAAGHGYWETLVSADEPSEFATAWLELQASRFGADLQKAVLVFGAGRGSTFTPVAVWPAGTMGSPQLVSAIERAIKRRKPEALSGDVSARRGEATKDIVAYPLLVKGEVYGAVAFEFSPAGESMLADRLEQVRWGAGWLETMVFRNNDSSADRLVMALNAVATVLDIERFQAAATAIATELAGKLRVDRLSIGFLKGRHTRIKALSHSASFDGKASLISAIEHVMDEAIDQQATIVYPLNDADPLRVIRSHEELHARHEIGAICTVPLARSGEIIGAMTLERPAGEPFDDSTVQLCEQIGALLGPVLDLKCKDDRPVIWKVTDSIRSFFSNLLGPRHVALKAGTGAAILVLAFFSFADGLFRVTADARLEGLVQRSVTAPIAGFISEANVRAGDTVRAGDLMFSLDDRDLWLERLKWNSQRSQFSREYSDAMAKRERARANVLSAQVEQAEAQLALIDEQLERIKVAAPFDSFVVSGDLSQSLGAPVERGDILFEVTPLNAYRVVLDVEERDIGEVKVGQPGNLVVTGMPGQRLPFVVERITPVAAAREGVNVFRVEARLMSEDLPLLRPGMEGYGKVDIEERKLIWIWTHKIAYWVRMFFWSWWP